MTWFAFLLLMQYVVSTKAGLVNHVQGPANITATSSVDAGVPLKTGPGGFAEVLLNPGSFLRVGENSEVIVENVELDTIVVRVVSGSAVIEAAGVSKRQPITVSTQDLTIELIESGIYVFQDGKAGVMQGKVRTADSKIEFKKGWQVDKDVSYRAVKLPKNKPDGVEAWSRERSEIMAATNVQVMMAHDQTDIVFGHDVWLFSSMLGGYTYLPRRQYQSPYGHRYYAPSNLNDGLARREQNDITAPGYEGIRGTPTPSPRADPGSSNPSYDRPAFSDINREKNVPMEATVP